MNTRGRPRQGILLAAFSAVMVLLSIPAVGQSSRYALVIGNGNYKELGKLKNPVNDAHDIGEALKGLGFKVETLSDADLPSMETAVVRLGNQLSTSPNAIGFFYYAGHGVQSNGINYLIPADAQIPSEQFLKTKALAAQEVLDILQDAHTSLCVVVLDACRDNPFSWARSGTRGLTVVGTQPPGSIIAYATSAGSVAQDGAGRNGVFTAEFLKVIRTPGIEIKEAFNRTGAAVQAATGGKQVPAIYNQFFGNVILSGGNAAPAASPGVASGGGEGQSAGSAPAEGKPVLTVQKAYGSMTIEVQTKGTLYLNGEALGEVTPGASARLDGVEVGQVDLEMRYTPNKTEKRAVEVKKNVVSLISFTQVFGSVTVQTQASGTLYVNGQPVGTPAPGSSTRLEFVEVGQASLEMRYGPGKTETQTVEVKKNAVAAVSFTQVYASVTVEVQTKGTLYLNDQPVGEPVPGSPMLLSAVNPGQATLKIVYGDGKTEIRTVDVKTDSVLKVPFTYLIASGPEGESMVRVAGGTFQMGFKGGGRDQQPVHQVTLSPFFMSKYEVTQKEWIAVMGSNPSRFKGDEQLPVENVSWNDAVSFCNKMSAMKGLSPCYTISGRDVVCDFSKNGYRLPTEAEWEFAAKGGGSGIGQFSGGSDAKSVAWSRGNSKGKTHPVGQLQPNELGIFDMSGNVWEWCWDRYEPYRADSQTDPQGASKGSSRVTRGGSWFDMDNDLRTSNRSQLSSDGKGPNYGFRLAMSAQ